MRALAGLALVLGLGACRPPEPAPAVPTANADSLAAATDSLQARLSEAVVTVSALTPGDRACYVTVSDSAGTRDEMADFGLCERTDLLGQRVLVTRTAAQVPAASCQGDPECADTETVQLIIAADPADAGL